MTAIMTAPDPVQQPAMTFDVERIRRDFPALHQQVNGQPLAYLDNAASTQKPQAVIDAISNYYRHDNANVHRGVHLLSQRATAQYEGARETIREYLNAASTQEIIYVRGTTEAINLVAATFGRQRLQGGDEIIISHAEHHSNIVPWQLLGQQTGACLRVVPVSDAGEFALDDYRQMLGKRTRLVAISHVSNALGTINPVRQIIAAAHAWGVPVLIDGAQGVPHLPVDVQELDCDFYAFSGHKLFGPTGIGVLYGKRQWLDDMPPYQGGGDMISAVSFEGTSYNELPYKFEAGTPNIAGAIGLAAAIDYVRQVGHTAIAAYERELLDYLTAALSRLDKVQLFGVGPERAGVLSFLIEGVHAHDIGTVLDLGGIAVRAGHHCAQPLMERLGVASTARASLAFYNTREEIDRLVAAIPEIIEVFG